MIANNISLTLYSKDYMLEMIESFHGLQPVKVHLKIDTGMNRLGLKSKSEFEEVLHTCQKSIFQVDGVLHILHQQMMNCKMVPYEEQLK